MRRFLYAAAGLCLASFAGLALADQLTGQPIGPPVKTPPNPAFFKAAEPAKADKADKADKEEVTVCKHSTAIEFVDTPPEAAKIAGKEGKLVFVLHVSGHLEDPRFL
jgi:hypothetical protein